MQIMGRSVSLTLVSAIFVALLSSQIILKPKFLRFFFLNQEFLSLPASMLHRFIVPVHVTLTSTRHHRHKHRPAVCDDFPPDFPPPDTHTTSILCVDKNGCCNFTTVQSAINAVRKSSKRRYIIWINKGIYYEKVIIPSSKPNITLQGQGLYSTAIAWNDTANSSHSTSGSASVSVQSANFIANNISFMNVAPMPTPGSIGAQAVAIDVGGDQAAFWGCGFFGAQDTLLDGHGRHYYKECFIQGSVDFIFGNARSLYENCELLSIAAAESRTVDGAVTAQARNSNEENSGFAFVNCTIRGTGLIWLGRAWRPYSRVIFANTFMSQVISPDGWNNFGDPNREQSVFYGEYNNTGAGANMNMRVAYARKLSEEEASPFLKASFIDADQWLQPFNTSLFL